MNLRDIRLLNQIHGDPCLTITLPTHRTSPENRQDPVRLKNLIAQATDRLFHEYPRRQVEPLVRRLEHLALSIEFRQTLDGLALFVHHDFERAFFLTFPVKERVVVDSTFYTRDLLYALNRSLRYRVLVLSEKPTRLYEGQNDRLEEIKENGFPMIHKGPGGLLPLPGGFGIRRSAHRDEHLRQFFRKVDQAFKAFQAEDPLPLIVAGVDRYHAFFDQVSEHSGAVIGRLHGNYDKASPHDLSRLIQPILEGHWKRQQEEALERLAQAVAERRFVSTMGEVWRAVHEGRGEWLLVEENFHYPARVVDSGNGLLQLVAADDLAAARVLDDAVDEVIAVALEKQGRVTFVPDGSLRQHDRVALIVRY